MSKVDFSEFSQLPFPEHADIVYVLCFKAKGSGDFTPFYVGQSKRSVGRFGDYVAANFTAPTDFKVGNAVKRLRERGLEVVIHYKPTNDCMTEEKILIESVTNAGFSLLNNLRGYDYTRANEAEERYRVEAFVERLVLMATPIKGEGDRTGIRAGIHDLEAGRVIPLAEVDARLRKKFGLPERAS